MSINPEFMTVFWLVVGALVYGLVLILALHKAQWWRLRDPQDLNVLLYSILGVLIIWTLNATYLPWLDLHLLGATLLTMMFGWPFAVLAISLVILVTAAIPLSSLGHIWMTLPWLALLTGVLPVFLSSLVFHLADRRLPNHFFVYIFICSFFGATLSMAVVIFATTGLHVLSGAHSLKFMAYNYLPYGLLLMLPEAFVTGMLMSIIVVYRPQWVSTFDDKRYLKN